MSLSKIILSVSNIIFPPRCGLCDEFLKDRYSLCGNCDDVPVVEKPICTNCGHSRENCVCKSKKHAYVRSVAPFYYKGAVERTIKNIKYSNARYRSDTLGAYMAHCVKDLYGAVNFDIVIPVPMYSSDKRKRGYNQAQDLAKVVAKICGIPFCKNVLAQHQKNKQQHLLSATERVANVRGIYKVSKPDMIKDKVILLCDDILTTGNTVDECAKMLIFSGAQKVYVVVAALAVAKT